MNRIAKFIHEFFNPHCDHCAKERMMILEQEAVDKDVELANAREDRRCRSCESLERQLAIANEQIIKLTEKIVNPNPISIPPQMSEASPKPLRRGPTPFHLIRQTLEQESRASAEALKNRAKPDSELNLQNNEAQGLVPPVNKAETGESNFKEVEAAVLNARTERETITGTKQ